MSKYKSRRTVVNERVFDSRKESRRYQELVLLERAGQISNLRLQVPFELIPAQMPSLIKCIPKAHTRASANAVPASKRRLHTKPILFTPIVKAIRLSRMSKASRQRTI